MANREADFPAPSAAPARTRASPPSRASRGRRSRPSESSRRPGRAGRVRRRTRARDRRERRRRSRSEPFRRRAPPRLVHSRSRKRASPTASPSTLRPRASASANVASATRSPDRTAIQRIHPARRRASTSPASPERERDPSQPHRNRERSRLSTLQQEVGAHVAGKGIALIGREDFDAGALQFGEGMPKRLAGRLARPERAHPPGGQPPARRAGMLPARNRGTPTTAGRRCLRAGLHAGGLRAMTAVDVHASPGGKRGSRSRDGAAAPGGGHPQQHERAEAERPTAATRRFLGADRGHHDEKRAHRPGQGPVELAAQADEGPGQRPGNDAALSVERHQRDAARGTPPASRGRKLRRRERPARRRRPAKPRSRRSTGRPADGPARRRAPRTGARRGKVRPRRAVRAASTSSDANTPRKRG